MKIHYLAVLVIQVATEPHLIGSLEYTKPVTPYPTPANRSPYEAILNTSVYESAPMTLNAKPEPTGITGQTHPYSRAISEAHPDPGENPTLPAESPIGGDPTYNVK